ncbi:MAG: hypothetical protein H8E70_00330 [Candidatus Marinimicrobia bacterium]|nr:hypothetical protein [Candidatus Neomarinimicrobiota bacterium]
MSKFSSIIIPIILIGFLSAQDALHQTITMQDQVEVSDSIIKSSVGVALVCRSFSAGMVVGLD